MELDAIPIVRSSRRTVGIYLRADGTVEARAPRRMPVREVRRFLAEHADWIETHTAKLRALPAVEPLTDAELADLRRRAKPLFAARAAHFAPLVGVEYGSVSVRCQRTRWGSCGSNGNLSFNCLLLLAPPEVLDSVVVHELCHRLHMDHSPAFYAAVRRVLPDYDQQSAWLRANGPTLQRRVRR